MKILDDSGIEHHMNFERFESANKNTYSTDEVHYCKFTMIGHIGCADVAKDNVAVPVDLKLIQRHSDNKVHIISDGKKELDPVRHLFIKEMTGQPVLVGFKTQNGRIFTASDDTLNRFLAMKKKSRKVFFKNLIISFLVFGYLYFHVFFRWNREILSDFHYTVAIAIVSLITAITAALFAKYKAHKYLGSFRFLNKKRIHKIRFYGDKVREYLIAHAWS